MVYEMSPKSNNPHSQFIGFASDNYSGAHPSVLEWLNKANEDFARPYNDDIYTSKFKDLMTDIFGKRVSVFPSLNGTGSNVFALRSVLPRWGTVCAPVTAHSNTDEAGAPEHMAGLKIITCPTKDGKIKPQDIIDMSSVLGDIHSAQPKIVSISNTTERGTVYSPQEIGQLVSAAHSRDMLVHVDGARIFNAMATSGFTSIEEGLCKTYGDTGVDIISLGGTKVGSVGAEAVIVLHPETSELGLGTKYSQKQMGQLSSKARFISAQFLGLLENDLALNLAKEANDKTKLLFDKFVQTTNAKKEDQSELSSGCSVYASGSKHIQDNNELKFWYTEEPVANAFFPTMPNSIVKKLREDYHFYDIEVLDGYTTIRLMNSFQTTELQIEEFINSLKHSIN